MSDLRLAQPGRIVFKRQFGPVVVELEFAQAVGVGKFAEAVQLLGRERRLQGVSDFEEWHGGSIGAWWRVGVGRVGRELRGLTTDRGGGINTPGGYMAV